jgi:hypothetical protein
MYEHGGVSPQECVTPVLTITRPAVAEHVTISEVSWVGLRVRVSTDGAPPGATLDLRAKAASPAASKLDRTASLSKDGTGSGLVPNPDAAGEAAFLVILDHGGALLAQRQTTIGGE